MFLYATQLRHHLESHIVQSYLYFLWVHLAGCFTLWLFSSVCCFFQGSIAHYHQCPWWLHWSWHRRTFVSTRIEKNRPGVGWQDGWPARKKAIPSIFPGERIWEWEAQSWWDQNVEAIFLPFLWKGKKKSDCTIFSVRPSWIFKHSSHKTVGFDAITSTVRTYFRSYKLYWSVRVLFTPYRPETIHGQVVYADRLDKDVSWNT